MIDAVTPFDLASPVEPWVVIARRDDHVARERISLLTPGGVVKRLDATRMADVRGLFSEFADKLEFPSYFGHNWYALVDCLDDLHGSWHGGLSVAVVVENAELVVDKEFFPLFVSLLCEAAERANLSLDADGMPRDRSPFRLHFLFFVNFPDVGWIADHLRRRDDLLIRGADGRLHIWS
jgi:RNAse (barnase) inhibitor barstar